MPDTAERINIKNIVIEGPIPADELPFDPQRDITPEQWNAIDRKLHVFFGPNESTLNRDFIAAIAMIDPEKIDSLMSPSGWRKIQDSYVSGETHLSKICQLKLIAPDRIDVDQLINAAWWDKLERQFLVENPWAKLKYARDVKLLDPGKSDTFELSGKDWDAVMDTLTGKFSADPEQWRKWSDFAVAAAKIKIVDPQRLPQRLLNNEAWKGMKQELSACWPFKPQPIGPDYSNQFATHAMNMAILGAEEVRMTDKGLELIMPEPVFIPDSPSLPSVRNF